MRVLVLGVSGMLGNAMFRVLSEDRTLAVYGSMRAPSALKHFAPELQSRCVLGIDVENQDSLTRAFAETQPSVVINCIGVVKQLDSATDPLSAIPVNSLLPHRIAALGQVCKARVVHFSTDCVFSGAKGGYLESDTPDAEDLYGRSKLLGELRSGNSLTLRTSIIGHELEGTRSLVGWFLAQSGPVKGYSHAYFSGLPTVELSRLVHAIVTRHQKLSGLYHVAAARISKLDLLGLVATEYQHDVAIVPSDSVKIDRSLDAGRFNSDVSYSPPPWPELVHRMRVFR